MRCTCTPHFIGGTQFHQADCRAQVWNAAIEAAAVEAEKFKCGGCGMDGKAAAAIRALVEPDQPAPLQQTM